MSLDFYPRKAADGRPVPVDSSFNSQPAPTLLGTLQADDDAQRWLQDTPLLQLDHPKIG